jgi:hypothetical protein
MADTVLLVPIHLDALYVKEARRVVQPTADFTRLPYADEDRDVNASVPWLSEEIVSDAFQNEHIILEKGIHLHWLFPKALTTGSHTANGESGGSEFPPAPDRWLVTQGQMTNGSPVVENQWVIESNYLWPEGARGEGLAYPIWKEPADNRRAGRPYRYIGRVMPLRQWRTRNRQNVEYLHPPLTAVGYGEPSFAAFYPNCHGVFGFHDPSHAERIPQGLYYQVIGWYGDEKNDYLQILMASARAHRGPPNETSRDVMRRILTERLRWSAGDRPPPDAAIVCHGSLIFQPRADPLWVPQLDQPKITFGATITEALSAYLAEEIARSENPEAANAATRKAEIEDQLEAVMLAPGLEYREVDLAAKFKEARHAKGFDAEYAGYSWTVRPRTDTAPPDPDSGPDAVPWPDVAEKLAALNVLQLAYNDAWDEIQAMRRQLYADWCKYMRCAYPPANAEADYPRIAQVRFFIEHKSLPALEKRIAAAGELIPPPDHPDAPPIASPASRDHSLAQSIEDGIRAVLATLAAHKPNGPGDPGYVLQRTSAPRYWRPTDPVILMTGEMVRVDEPTYIEDVQSDGLLKCGTMGPILGGIEHSLDRLSVALNRQIGANARVWTEQPWHPFLLQWEVELTPFNHLGNLSTTARDYEADFVTRNFTLRRSDADLSTTAKEPALAKGAHVYKGASLLTPHGVDHYIARLEDYLSREREYQAKGDPRRSALSADTLRRLEAALARLRAKNFFCLAQRLSGFNDALLMRMQQLELPIDDPIGFAEYRRFAACVRAAVADDIHGAPLPFNDFSPIRTGELQIRRLRLISTFGRIKDFECRDCQTATPMPWRSRDGRAALFLPPRLVQPARLQFRWLAAADGRYETNAHPDSTPICGWVIANYLDNNLFFYAGDGRVLGFLEVEEPGPVRWRRAPGAKEPIIRLDEIENQYLRRIVAFFLRGSPAYFNGFFTDLKNAQMKIAPEYSGDPLPMGQPLALVRASLSLELQGPPALHQGWNEFRLNMTRRVPDTDNFTRVRFPIRLGEQDQLNDGLAVYWQEDDPDGYVDNAYVIPNYDDATSNPEDKACDFLYQAIEDPPLKVTMLMDPRGMVHASTGILPIKTIQIPPHQYASAVKQFEMTFLTAPVLSAGRGVAGVNTIGLPVSDPPGYNWSWLERRGGDWVASSISAAGLFTPFASPVEIREGWLKLTRTPPQGTKS